MFWALTTGCARGSPIALPPEPDILTLPARERHVRVLSWTHPLAVATGLARRPAGSDGVVCLLSDASVPGSRSFIAADPDNVVVVPETGDMFAPLKEPALSQGVIGLASYDAGARAATGPRETFWPDLMLARYPSLLMFDHDAASVAAVGWGADGAQAQAASARAATWLDLARQVSSPPPPPPPPAATMTAEADAETYRRAVATVVERIDAGDLFQANIARGWTGELRSDANPFDVFLRLATAETDRTAPFGAYWRIGDRALVSNSPELFLTCDFGTRRIETRPIKGTRPRDADPQTDAANAQMLAASAKDQAENLMIVDLMRNDLARVSTPGSVVVERLFEIESHAAVHHLVSTVTAQLRHGVGPAETLAATFPPGSITGAPKHQAMKVIASLEPPRGAWCGSLFILDEAGDLTASVLIRTTSFERVDGEWRFRTLAGAGIVADSVPQVELEETEAKISAMRRALVGPD